MTCNPNGKNQPSSGNVSAAAAQLEDGYKRPAWKHYSRFVALAGMLVLDCMLIASSVRMHLHPAHALTITALGKEGVLYLLILLCNIFVLPSIVLEANRVRVTEDKLVLDTLLYSAKIPWREITNIVAPIYLKFAVIKTGKFFYLINKRDIQGYPELIDRIREKTEQQSLPSK